MGRSAILYEWRRLEGTDILAWDSGSPQEIESAL